MKKKYKYFFSVIIPCYNVEESIFPTLKSLSDQTFNNFETIFINDGSTDKTKKIITDFHLDGQKRVINQVNKGLGAARNSGIKISEGKYIALLDADDIWLKNKLQKMYEYILENDSEIYCHNEYLVNEENIIIKKNFYGPYSNFEDLFFKNTCLSPSAVILKRNVFDNVGFFTENLKLHGVEDYDFWLRSALKSIKINYISEFLGSYVIHGNNMSTNPLFINKIECLHIYYSKIIKLKSRGIILRYKLKFLKIYLLKLKILFNNKLYKNVFNVIFDIGLLIISINKFLNKKNKDFNL